MTFSITHCLTSGGDGGIAGRGGVITVVSTATLEAYNGNRYTDGTDYEDGKNQLEIFAQKGELRDVYKYNFWWDKKQNYNAEFFVSLFGNTVCDEINSIKQPTTKGELQNVLVRKQTTCDTLSYINPKTNSCQGIGSRSGLYRIR